MIYAKDIQRNVSDESVQTLIQALPWIKNATGKTVVIKYGGAAMENTELMHSVMTDILLLKIIGLNPVIVHGGGKSINAMLKRVHKEVIFEQGLRVTDNETMDIVRMVLMGQVNPDLVNALNRHGNVAVGLSGSDAGMLKAVSVGDTWGRVGRIVEVDPAYIHHLVDDDYIPIIASIAQSADEDDTLPFNVNADAAAGDIAAAIGAHKIIFLTDVDGLYETYPDPDTLITRLNQSDAQALIDSGTMSEGMIPKLQACVHALAGGVARAHIVNGTLPHAILLELLTDSGVGTMIKLDSDDDAKAHALSPFTARLSENLDN
ncbi:MAG: acetylglutamate kinase [Eggerthellaceae bacterium]|nr:acetylglutamate kinase [Eggerthellaceae bacterium]